MTDPGAQSTQPVTRHYLLDALGEAMVTPLVARDGVYVAVTALVIHDFSAAPVIEPGDVVLAVGLSLDDRDGTALLQRPGEAGATAVAFRSATHGERSPPEVPDTGVAELQLNPELAWGQFFALARGLVLSTSYVSESTPQIAGGDLLAWPTRSPTSWVVS